MDESIDLEWLPDWRDESQYPDKKYDTSGEYAFAWAWEYLRRNPAYQDFYDRKIGEMPDLSDEETRKKFVKKISSEQLKESFSLMFGIITPMDYRQDWPPVFTSHEIIYDPFFESTKKEVTLCHGEALVRINLLSSVGPQIELAKKKLVDIQKKSKDRKILVDKRNRGSIYHIQFLRLLDAKRKGADIEDMYKEIIQKYSTSYKTAKEAVDKNLKPAEDFMNGGYRIIASQAAHQILPYNPGKGIGSSKQKRFKDK